MANNTLLPVITNLLEGVFQFKLPNSFEHNLIKTQILVLQSNEFDEIIETLKFSNIQ
jgi:hypothetical protein